MTAKSTIDAQGMIVSPGLIDGHTHSDHFLDVPTQAQRANPAWTMQGVSTVFIGIDGNGTPDMKDQFAKFNAAGHRHQCRLLCRLWRHPPGGDRRGGARAHTSASWPRNKRLWSRACAKAPSDCPPACSMRRRISPRPTKSSRLAKEAGKRGGIYDTHQRDEFSYSIGLIASTKEVLQIGREGGIPVHFSHIKALGQDVWGKSADVIKLIDDARAAGQNVTANHYPWLASHTGLDAALIPRWASDGGDAAMLKRFDDPALMAKIKTEMAENLRPPRRRPDHS